MFWRNCIRKEPCIEKLWTIKARKRAKTKKRAIIQEIQPVLGSLLTTTII
jgi:hypothetical protein